MEEIGEWKTMEECKSVGGAGSWERAGEGGRVLEEWWSWRKSWRGDGVGEGGGEGGGVCCTCFSTGTEDQGGGGGGGCGEDGGSDGGGDDGIGGGGGMVVRAVMVVAMGGLRVVGW